VENRAEGLARDVNVVDPLAGKAAIVTGASKGIGRAVAKLYAAEGAKVLAVFRSDRKASEAATEEIKAAGGSVSFFQADVSKKRDADRMADKAIRLYGRIDVLCSNAGVYPAASLESMTEDDWAASTR
jgi:3-oxoacyl-[acyl-carrier protein] reductase